MLICKAHATYYFEIILFIELIYYAFLNIQLLNARESEKSKR